MRVDLLANPNSRKIVKDTKMEMQERESLAIGLVKAAVHQTLPSGMNASDVKQAAQMVWSLQRKRVKISRLAKETGIVQLAGTIISHSEESVIAVMHQNLVKKAEPLKEGSRSLAKMGIGNRLVAVEVVGAEVRLEVAVEAVGIENPLVDSETRVSTAQTVGIRQQTRKLNLTNNFFATKFIAKTNLTFYYKYQHFLV